MDVYEATRVVLARIQSLDAVNAAKIMGYILIQEHGDKEMIRLAFGPEALLHSVVLKARKELGLAAPAPPPSSSSATPPAAGGVASPSPFGLLARQNSSSRFSTNLVSSPTSFAPPPVFSRAGRANGALNGSLEELQASEELLSPGSPSPSPFFNGCATAGDSLVDEFHLQDQLSFLHDQAPCHSLPIGPRSVAAAGGGDLFSPDIGSHGPSGSGDGLLFPYRLGWGVNGNHHRRSWSAADLPLRSDATAAAGFGWKPCLYFARGYCKDGTACRFLHDLPDETVAAVAAGARMDAAVEQQCQELLLRSKSQRIGGGAASRLTASAFPYSPLGSLPSSPSSTSKCLDFLLQQQPSDSPTAAAAAAAAALMRTRMERGDFAGMANPGSRQIYLTFPADSTFTEEDVSSYFSIYGPVQDVRIPFQQKRMFGFVTFGYPETVKLILAKGNPHFVCDARVLVKPYKEKGKVPDKCRKQQQQQTERGDFAACTTPTGLESRDQFDLQQLAAARMLYNSSSGQELLLRRKLEEQQQALELQQAIELHARRLMNLQLLDLKNRTLCSSAPAAVNSPTIEAAPAITIPTADTPSSSGSGSGSSSSQEQSPTGVQKMNSSNGFLEHKTVNSADKKESGDEANPTKDGDIHESAEHNLPDSPFASPKKSSVVLDPFSVPEAEIAAATAASVNNSSSSSSNTFLIASTLPPSSSALDMASHKSCFFQMPSVSSGHGAIGM
ncbi:zinc finger CCCH domain-containing protein [Musa troglodytarum]|uniref:Zinc finger CCCH domain-containing protein n=1 Tax=Musa troglodytarum TaxID=320322 RepID=A0A9E7LF85_9LILI|nr:zinc finger CCCH domain-containing protein [Musa troglodytarum]